MSRWKELPDSLDPRVRQFVVRLRRLKDHSGLGLAALASRTGYSRSSWDRYLNGRSLPPADAVEALAVACDSEPAPLLALREVAAEGWESEADAGADTDPAAAPASAPAAARRPVPWLAIVLSSLCTALVMLAVFALLAPWEEESGDKGDDRPYTGDAHPEYGEFEYEPGKSYECRVKRDDDGRLYAGYSRTRTELIERQSTRWSVVEAQCLLEYREASPGVADGAFGNNTERAVKRIQDKGNIAVDGKIGPDTWKVLRK
ncbi:helix-turn-helix domain-containing protein [Streptomyces sp. NPDC050658]|uniref:helix-turn-helix domain-containing protein n=1 Tax=unclassified Streptomyces TaxID=2593676 RepID=UPI00342134C9